MGFGKDVAKLDAVAVHVAQAERTEVVAKWMVYEGLVRADRYEIGARCCFAGFADHEENSSFVNRIRMIAHEAT